jgi:hypothetical protein
MIRVRMQSGHAANGKRNVVIQNQGRVRKATAYISYLHLHPVISVCTMGGKNVGTNLQDYKVSQLSTPQSQHYSALRMKLLLK